MARPPSSPPWPCRNVKTHSKYLGGPSPSTCFPKVTSSLTRILSLVDRLVRPLVPSLHHAPYQPQPFTAFATPHTLPALHSLR